MTLRWALRAVANRITLTPCRRYAARLKHTINLHDSIEYGYLIPAISDKDIGVSSLIGHRKSQEDRVQVKTLHDRCLFVAVFDGHGGTLAAQFAHDTLHQAVDDRLVSTENHSAVSIQTILTQAFNEVNNRLLQFIRKQRPGKERYSGTTATVCLLIDNIHLHTASVGDSRALLCHKGEAVALTSDHSPDRPDEKERIESEGGAIISNSLGEPQVNGRLAMTRSIGDFDLKPYGVTADPEYQYRKVPLLVSCSTRCGGVDSDETYLAESLKEHIWLYSLCPVCSKTHHKSLRHSHDSFLVLVTDGITFTMANQELVNLVSSRDSAKESADHLTDSAIHLRSHDNCTAVVVPLGAWGSYRQDDSVRFQFGRSLSNRD